MIRYGLALCIIASCFSFSESRHKTKLPPGTVQISETFFADETEISNGSWREYENWTSLKFGKNSPEHLATLPDTSVWMDPKCYNAPYASYYYRHVAYKEYPVVGVTYEQALAFCQWRTQRVKEYYYLAYKKEYPIAYRLPTREEWELISNNGIEVFSHNGKNEKGLLLLNCFRDADTNSYAGAQDLTAPVYSYWKNRFGLFNAFGNVAEMLAEKGQCKGGSWRHHFEDCRAGKSMPYSKPEAWLGFRCVCVLAK